VRPQVSFISLANSIQAYTTIHYAARVYNPNPDNTKIPSNLTQYTNPSKPTPLQPGELPSQVTPLSGRKWGTWTALTGIVRFYVAYHINEKGMFELGMWTYAIAWAHYMSGERRWRGRW
jgi:hypothetical protein